MQLVEGWRRNIEELIYRQGGVLLLQAGLFVIGLIFGALALRSLDSATRLDLTRQLSDSVRILGQEAAQPPGELFREALLRQFLQLGLIWLLAVTLVGAVAVLFLPLVRGFISGFAVAYLTAELGKKGLLMAAAGHLPQSLLEVPGLILATTASTAFALEVLRSWRLRRRLTGFYPALADYTTHLLAAGVLLVGACLVEGYLTPSLLRLIATKTP